MANNPRAAKPTEKQYNVDLVNLSFIVSFFWVNERLTARVCGFYSCVSSPCPIKKVFSPSFMRNAS